MTVEMWLALGIFTVAIVMFVTEWLRVDLVAISVVVALMLTGLLSTNEALSGFSNPTVLTIAALFVVGGGVLQTGLAGTIGRRILAVAGAKPARLTLVLMLAVALLSGFMSDTGTVAVLLPAVISLSRSTKIPPSKLLIPLSFGALLGGASTLIGTTPNLIVSELLTESGWEPFRFFDFTPLGLLMLAAGVLFMIFIGRRMLPDRRSVKEVQRVETPAELVDIYRLPDNLFRLRIRQNSPLAGQTLTQAEVRKNFNVTVLEVQRKPGPRPLVKLGDNQIMMQSGQNEVLIPEPDLKLIYNDILVVQGEHNDVNHMAAVLNLGIQPITEEGENSLITQEAGIAEVLLPPRSNLLGKTLADLKFGSQYNLTVLGISNSSAVHVKDIVNYPFKFGDTLLVQGSWEDILALRKQRKDFIVMGQPEVMLGPPMRKKAPVALIILLVMLVLMVFNIMPVANASMVAGLLMVLTGCLTIDDAYNAIDWKSIVLMAGMLPMSIALENVGLVEAAANWLTGNLGGFSPGVVLAALFFITAVLTQVLSNTATTFIVAPLALAAAGNMQVAPYAFMMAVAVAASMAFGSPVASPVNTLVMGAGDYRFSDFIRIGGMMILLMMGISVLVLPLLFPF